MTIRSLFTALLLCCSLQAGALTITVASFPDLDRAAQSALPRWKQLHPDIEVKIVSRQYPDHHTAMTAALSTGAGLPDVMAVDFRFIGRFAAGHGLTDLGAAPFNAHALRSQFVAYTWPQGTSPNGDEAATGRSLADSAPSGGSGGTRPRGGRFVAMPADIGPGTLLYRTDLLAKAGLSEADLTGSWESFIAAGTKLKAATGAYLLADSTDIRDIILRAGLAPGQGIYFDDKGGVLVDSPRFVRAFEFGRAARRAGIDAGSIAWTNDWVAGLRRDRIATLMQGGWMAGHLKNWLAPDSNGKWRSTVLPAGATASYGGSFYVIPAKSPNKQAAWEFIKFMCADVQTQVQSLRTLDSFPALLAAQNDPLFDEPMPYLGGQRARQLWRDIAAKVPPVPVHRLDAMATDVIRAEYELVLKGKDIGKSLADARALIEHRMHRP